MAPPNQNNNNPAGFFRLPPELRNDIYTRVLDSNQLSNVRDLSRGVIDGLLRPYVLHAGFQQQPADPALMQVNRQLRQEVGDIFLGVRDMRLTSSMRELPVIVDYVRRVRRDVGRQAPFASLTINLLETSWQTLQDILPLVDFLRTSDFDQSIRLESRGAQSGASRPNLATSLQRAIDIGLRARREGWDEARMRREVPTWADGQRQTTPALAAAAAAAAARQQKLMRPKRPWYEGKRRR